MAEHNVNGVWTISSRGVWLPGMFATRRAARAAYRLSDANLAALWQRKGFAENGNADGTTSYAMTEDDVRAALAVQSAS